MPASLPIPRLGLTFQELVDIVQACGGMRMEGRRPSTFRHTLAARLRPSHPLLSFKVGRLSLGQMDALCSYLMQIM
jgi:hypothetical protein